MSLGELLIARLVDDQDLERWARYQLKPELFRADEHEVFQAVQAHALKFGALPKREIIEGQLGIELPVPVEPADYYLDHVERRMLQHGLADAIKEADAALKANDQDTAMSILTKAVVGLRSILERRTLVNLATDAWPMIQQEYAIESEGGHAGRPTLGWPTLDEMSGGLRGSDVVVFVGRPAMGKTFKLLKCALHMWEQGHVPLFVSMEMEPLELIQRLAAMQAHVPLKHLMKAQLVSDDLKKVKGVLKDMPGKQPFWLVDGDMASSVDDLILACHQLKPTCLLVDGAYLMTHPDPRASTWTKVKDNVEGVKRRIGKRLGIPSVLSYQFNRQITKLKKEEQAGLEHVGLSDTVGQVATIVLGLFEEDSAGTLKRRVIRVLKGRRGEVGQFMVNWDFQAMDFSECKEPALDALELLGLTS